MYAYDLTNTIQLAELVWTLIALPGLVLWIINRISAGQTLRAARAMGISNGRMLFARFGVRETTAWTVIDAVFVIIGVVAMTNASNPDADDSPTRLLVAAGLIGASCIVTYLGWSWREIDVALVRLAAERAAELDREDEGQGEDKHPTPPPTRIGG